MIKNKPSPWMFSPKSFISLLGAEYDLMRDAGVLKRFYVSSLLIIIIMLLTCISIYYAINLLFHTITIEIILSLFFCLLFACIYIFLLNTFAKDNREGHPVFNISNIIRIVFIAFMGFLIAQPLIILTHKRMLSPVVENHKQQLLKIHTAQIDTLVKDEIANLVNRQQYYIGQIDSFGTSLYNSELNKINDAIKLMQDKANAYKQAAQQTIDLNSFFLYRVQKVNSNHPLAWLLTLIIILLFLLPGYLVYTISSQHEYYQLKKIQEKKLVMDAYGVFVMHYKKIFNEQVTIFSRYEDPPFNTVRKQPPVPASMTDFLQKYLANS